MVKAVNTESSGVDANRKPNNPIKCGCAFLALHDRYTGKPLGRDHW
jgi:hypothetical protein